MFSSWLIGPPPYFVVLAKIYVTVLFLFVNKQTLDKFTQSYYKLNGFDRRRSVMSPKAVRGIVTLVSVLIFAVVSGVVFFFGPHGGFSGYLEKEPFDSVNYFWGRHHRTLIFGNVGETDHAVWVELE